MSTRKTGTREWSEHSVNWQLGCSNGCLYCYARQQALRFKRIKTPEEWTKERGETFTRGLNAMKKYKGVVMCPTQHDITPKNLRTSIALLSRLAALGNRLLIVSKPRPECIEALCDALRDYKDRVEFRFSIGCLDENIRRFWEPGAPCVVHRIVCLRETVRSGFKTSVSCEPLLEPWNAKRLVTELRRHTGGDVWIGCLNHMDQRIAWARPTINEDIYNRSRVIEMGLWQDSATIRTVFSLLDGIPGIRFKDSYQKVLGIDSYGKAV